MFSLPNTFFHEASIIGGKFHGSQFVQLVFVHQTSLKNDQGMKNAMCITLMPHVIFKHPVLLSLKILFFTLF